MKRIMCFLTVVILMLLVGCRPVETEFEVDNKQDYISGVWLTYAELDKMLTEDFKSEFKTVVDNCKSRNISDIFVHTTPFCDVYYSSEIFPLRQSAKSEDYDVLKYMVEVCHKSNINFHAWINPYRVRTADNIVANLSDKSPAKIWATDQNKENDLNVSTVGGIYLNPASSEVRALIIDGVREVIDGYDVDGIHFDDYFYPTTDESFDNLSYSDYCSKTKNPLPLAEFRRANVNALISGVYTAVKFKDKDIIFSVSPSASVGDNYNKHYADVAAWVENSCVDYIIPQLYFGFEYPDGNYNFEKLLTDWKEITKNTDTKLIIGLAVYKIKTDMQPDCAEWENGKDIIKRQTQICENDGSISGHIYFSYTSMCKYV